MILPWLILIPFIGGFLCWLGERFGATLPRWIALLTMSLLLGIGLWLWATGDYTLAPAPGAEPAWALEYKLQWIQRFGISIHLALDGLSLLMILLTGLLGVLSVLCSWKEIQRHVGFFHLNLMWILGGRPPGSRRHGRPHRQSAGSRLARRKLALDCSRRPVPTHRPLRQERTGQHRA